MITVLHRLNASSSFLSNLKKSQLGQITLLINQEDGQKHRKFFFLKKKSGPFPASFIYFRLFNTVDNKQMLNKILPMTGVEPRTSGISSDRSTN